MPHCFMEMKIIKLQMAEFNNTMKTNVKKWCDRLVRFDEISLQQLKQYSVVSLAPMCLHAWQHHGMLLMRQQMVPWGISSEIWTVPSLYLWTMCGVTCWVKWTETKFLRGGLLDLLNGINSHVAGHRHAPGGFQDPLHKCRVWKWLQVFHPNT